MALDLTKVEAVLKTLYRNENVESVIATENRFLSLVPKFEANVGKDQTVAPKYGYPETISSTFSAALAAAADEASKWGEMNVTSVTKHGLAHIDGDTIAATSNDKGAFIKAIKEEIDGVMKGMANRRAQELWATGYGEIGASTAAGTASLTVSLSNARKVEKGQKHIFAAAVGSGALRDSGASLTVSSVNRSTGVITYTANISTISGLVSGDYIFNKGDRHATAASKLCLTGFEGWIPAYGHNFSGDSFFGLDRSQDPTRLAGQRLDGSTGNSIEEVLLEADAMVTAEGGALDYFFVAPETFRDIAVSLGSRVRHQPMQVGKVGFSSLVMVGQMGDISIVADRFVPTNRIYGATLNSWELSSSGKIVKLNDDDNLQMVRISDQDGVQVRLVSRLAQLICKKPAFNVNIAI